MYNIYVAFKISADVLRFSGSCEDDSICSIDAPRQVFEISKEVMKINNCYSFRFDEGSDGVGVMGYTYNLNLVVKAESISKSCESSDSKQNSGPITVKLGKIHYIT